MDRYPAPQDDADAYAELLIMATWQKQGREAAARIIARLDAPFLADDARGDAGGAAGVGRRIAALAAYCRDEILPVVQRLEQGLDHIVAASGDPARTEWRSRAVAYWPELRADL